MDNKQELELEAHVAAEEDALPDAQEEYAAVDENGVVAQEKSNTDPTPPESVGKGKSGRRDFLHILCGAYLLYLAYKLIPSFVGPDAGGWTAMRIVSLVGAVLFGAVGVILIVGVIKRFVKKTRDKTE